MAYSRSEVYAVKRFLAINPQKNDDLAREYEALISGDKDFDESYGKEKNGFIHWIIDHNLHQSLGDGLYTVIEIENASIALTRETNVGNSTRRTSTMFKLHIKIGDGDYLALHVDAGEARRLIQQANRMVQSS